MKVEEIQELELGKTRQMAFSDPLTGVKNKMAYIEDVGCFEQRIEDGALHDFGLVVFDLNDLKKTNDTLGHDAGDNYIKQGSSLICNSFKHSPVYRIGGDEFVVFLSGEDYKNRETILSDFNDTIENNLKTGEVVIAFGFADYATVQEKGFMRLQAGIKSQKAAVIIKSCNSRSNSLKCEKSATTRTWSSSCQTLTFLNFLDVLYLTRLL